MYSLVLPNGASKEPCTWCLPASGAFHEEKKNQTFWLLFGYFYFYVAFRSHQRTKKYYFLHLCKLEETGGNSTLSLIPQMCTQQDHPSSTELSVDRLKLHLPLLFQDICFSLCRIYYYSAVSLITHDTSVHASIDRGLRGRNSPSWGF